MADEDENGAVEKKLNETMNIITSNKRAYYEDTSLQQTDYNKPL